MTSRVLVVESGSPSELARRLETESYRVAVVTDRAVTHLLSAPTASLVAGLLLPNMTIPDLIQKLPKDCDIERISAVLLCTRGIRAKQYPNLPTGAYEYIPRSVSVLDLEDRVRGVLLHGGSDESPRVVVAGDLVVDQHLRRAYRGERELQLGPVPFRTLEILMTQPGKILTRQELRLHVWGQEVTLDQRTIDVEVGRVRSVLNRGKDRDPIRTVRGVGYAFDETYGLDEPVTPAKSRRRSLLPS